MPIDPTLPLLIKELASFFKEIVVSIISVGWMLFQFFIILMAFVYRESLAALFAGTIESLKMPGVDLQMRKKEEAKLEIQKQVVAIAEQIAEPASLESVELSDKNEETTESKKTETAKPAPPFTLEDASVSTDSVKKPESVDPLDPIRNLLEGKKDSKLSRSTVKSFYKSMTKSQLRLLYLIRIGQIQTFEDAAEYLMAEADLASQGPYEFAMNTMNYLTEAKIILVLERKYLFLTELGFDIVKNYGIPTVRFP